MVVINCDRLILYFILVLAVIAVSIWTVFLIQLSQLVSLTTSEKIEHSMISEQGKQSIELNVNMTKINKKNIENMLNNLSEMNKKLQIEK